MDRYARPGGSSGMMRRAALMRRWGRLLGGLAALGLLLALAGPQVAAAGVARLDVIDVNTANYPAVKVTFSVADQDGQPITGLDQHALKVVENGQEQAVTSAYALRNSPTPLSVMLAFDTSASMKDAGKFEQAKAAAKAFIAQMRPIDRLGLVQFDSAFAVAAPFSGDRGMLSKKVDGLTAQGNTRLYDALYLAINEVARVDGSKAVVLLTDGQDTESAADLGQVLALTRDRGVRVYAIGVGAEIDERVLGQLAQASGGAFYRAPTANDIAYAFRAMSNQLRNRYEISYNSPASAAQGATVEVKVLADTPSGQLTGLGSYLAPAYTPRARSSDAIGGQLQAVGAAPARSPIANSLIYASSLLAALGILLISSGQALSRSLVARRERLRHFVSRGHATREAEAGDSLLGVVVVGIFRLLARIST